jgi:hypothetical protein
MAIGRDFSLETSALRMKFVEESVPSLTDNHLLMLIFSTKQKTDSPAVKEFLRRMNEAEFFLKIRPLIRLFFGTGYHNDAIVSALWEKYKTIPDISFEELALFACAGVSEAIDTLAQKEEIPEMTLLFVAENSSTNIIGFLEHERMLQKIPIAILKFIRLKCSSRSSYGETKLIDEELSRRGHLQGRRGIGEGAVRRSRR